MNTRVDGSKSLIEQQMAINHAQQTGKVQLVSYQKGTAPANYAMLDEVPLGQSVLPLLLVEVAAASIGVAVATHMAIGKQLVFYNAVYVQGIVAKVAGFR
ncbi:MAG: hypothetical protein JWQ21_3307 [Herminiimonas sp.]|nr:hypothetical protein [Herminiimonas sp.]